MGNKSDAFFRRAENSVYDNDPDSLKEIKDSGFQHVVCFHTLINLKSSGVSGDWMAGLEYAFNGMKNCVSFESFSKGFKYPV